MNKVELLAPAGSLMALQAAVESGADAVYIGGSKFNARAFAQNAEEDILRSAVEYAHIRGAKVYVTVNIVILQNELEEVLQYIKYLYSIHVDAVIVQDIGLAVLIQRLMPDFEVHCSTQMAIHNSDGAEYLSGLGIKRVVLARELTLSEVEEISKAADIDAEIFIHGALCVSYSGQCYMSSLIGGRSGNRGKCAQPCRKKYKISGKSTHLISTRDLNTYAKLPEILKSNVASLKIEGRMKRPEYVAIIVENYRKAIDCIKRGETGCITPEAEYELLIAFNREFTKGYLFGERNQQIVSTVRPDNRGIYIGRVLNQKGNIVEVLLENNDLNDGDSVEIINPKGKSIGTTISGIKRNGETVKKAVAGDKIRIYVNEKTVPGSLVSKTIDSELFDKANREYAYTNRKKIGLKGVFTAKLGEYPALEIKDQTDHYVKAAAEEPVQKAEKQAVTEEKVREQLDKTGDTPYYFADLQIDIDESIFLPLKTINNLRRNAIELLNQKRIEIPNRNPNIEIKQVMQQQISYGKRTGERKTPEIITGVRSLDAAKAALSAGADTVYILGDYRYKDNQMLLERAAALCKEKNCSIFYVLPQITRNHELKHIEAMLQEVLSKGHEIGIVLSNVGHIPLAKRLHITRQRGNFSLNIVNTASAEHFMQQGLECIGLSPELSLSQIREITEGFAAEFEGMVYGYLPAMITEYCPNSAAADCRSCRTQGFKTYDITDERDKRFKVINMGNCRNLFLNSDVLCVYDHLSSIIESGVSRLRLDFFTEEDRQIFDIVEAYKQRLAGLSDGTDHDIIKEVKSRGFTKGHYFRGLD